MLNTKTKKLTAEQEIQLLINDLLFADTDTF